MSKVEADKADKSTSVEQAAVAELYIRGWKLDDVMVGILAECFPTMTSLHTLDLWNVGLDDAILARLANLLTRCRALRSLLLDANPVPGQQWHLFLQVICKGHMQTCSFSAQRDRISSQVRTSTRRDLLLVKLE